MKGNTSTLRLACTVRCAAKRATSMPEICHNFSSLQLVQYRRIHVSQRRLAVKTLNPTTADVHRPVESKDAALAMSQLSGSGLRAKPEQLRLTPGQRAAAAAARARENLKTQTESVRQNMRMGGLSKSSVFADAEMDAVIDSQASGAGGPSSAKSSTSLASRSPANMAMAINPRPNARARWQRKMVIREVRRGGRITREMKLARTERSHLSRSHFFKTSMKKLAPLARQIAGKSIDEAIVQMRFSKKKVANEVRKHLIQARDEAVVVRGMGLKQPSSVAGGDVESSGAPVTITPIIHDATTTPPEPHQTAGKATRAGLQKNQTDMYIAQAWVGRGPYGQAPDYRARGRLNIMRPPYTGISVLLKEEKTRTREQDDKAAKELRRRMGKNMWTQLPDRKVTRQTQHVLW